MSERAPRVVSMWTAPTETWRVVYTGTRYETQFYAVNGWREANAGSALCEFTRREAERHPGPAPEALP